MNLRFTMQRKLDQSIRPRGADHGGLRDPSRTAHGPEVDRGGGLVREHDPEYAEEHLFRRAVIEIEQSAKEKN
jgi:hypothetical protein